eukprot:g45000.t1
MRPQHWKQNCHARRTLRRAETATPGIDRHSGLPEAITVTRLKVCEKMRTLYFVDSGLLVLGDRVKEQRADFFPADVPSDSGRNEPKLQS